MSVLLSMISQTVIGQELDLLSSEEAFSFKAELTEAGVEAHWLIADGYYMYRNKLAFSLTNKQGQPIPTQVDFPKGKVKSDPSFGDVEVYTKHADFLIPYNMDSREILLHVEGQGCNEPIGVCYPPIKLDIPLSMATTASLADTQAGGVASNTDTQAGNSPQASSKLWWVLLTAFAAGIGLTFTPCVLPLIPILSSIIAGQGGAITKSRAAGLSAVYVLGTAVTYAAIGAVAGATGEQLQAYFQNAWAIGAMALIFLLMALSMFGLFNMQMPAFIQSRLSSSTQELKGGSAPMVFVLGLMSALIVGACVSPILISFLSLAIAEGSATLGALTMFSMAIGMGIPLVVLGVGAGHLLPKAGKWMDNVKYVFGVLLLGIAIYLLSVLPQVPVLYLWAALLIIVAIFLGATQPLPEGGTGWQKFNKGLGTLVLLWGGFSLIGALYGERDIIHPLPERLFSASSTQLTQAEVSTKPGFTLVKSITQLEDELERAKTAGKNVMIDYYADWCVNCVKLEKTTFSDPKVLAVLNDKYVSLQIDVTNPVDIQAKALKKRYGVFGPPAILFIDRNGKPIKEKNFYGYKNPEDFLEYISS